MILSRRNQRRQTMKRVALGSSIAAVAGYLAGILTAPKSGKDTRGDIRAAANKGVAEAEKDIKKAQVELDKLIADAKVAGGKAGTKAKTELADLVDKAKNAGDKTKEVVTAVRAGTAKDEDLAKALKQSQNALNNLRKYLKK
jgi:gas vesicle protein